MTRKGTKESAETKAKRLATIQRKQEERKKLIEDGNINLEDGLKPMCQHVDEEGSRCMNFAEQGKKFCIEHRKGNGVKKEHEDFNRRGIIEAQIHNQIKLQISQWGKQLPYSMLMEFVLSALGKISKKKNVNYY